MSKLDTLKNKIRSQKYGKWLETELRDSRGRWTSGSGSGLSKGLILAPGDTPTHKAWVSGSYVEIRQIDKKGNPKKTGDVLTGKIANEWTEHFEAQHGKKLAHNNFHDVAMKASEVEAFKSQKSPPASTKNEQEKQPIKEKEQVKAITKTEEIKKIPLQIKDSECKRWGDSWSNTPNDLREVLNKIPEPKKEASTNDNVFYRPSTHAIAMADREPKSVADQAVWRHEYGHSLDYRIGKMMGLSTPISYSDKGRKATSADSSHLDTLKSKSDDQYVKLAKSFPEIAKLGYGKETLIDIAKENMFDEIEKKAMKTKVKERSERSEDANKFLDSYHEATAHTQKLLALHGMTSPNTNIEKWVDHCEDKFRKDPTVAGQIYRELLKNPANVTTQSLFELLAYKEIPDPVRLAKIIDSNYLGRTGMTSDLIGSITLNKIGNGHSDEYYKLDNGRIKHTEVFANLTTVHGHGSPALASTLNVLAPNSYKFYQDTLKRTAAKI